METDLTHLITRTGTRRSRCTCNTPTTASKDRAGEVPDRRTTSRARLDHRISMPPALGFGTPGLQPAMAPRQLGTLTVGDQVTVIRGTTGVSAGGARHAVSDTSATSAKTTTTEASTAWTTPAPAIGPVFRPLPVRIVNNFVNIPRFANLLRGYPDAPLVNFVLHGFQHGFNIGFHGQINEQHRRNNKSA